MMKTTRTILALLLLAAVPGLAGRKKAQAKAVPIINIEFKGSRISSQLRKVQKNHEEVKELEAKESSRSVERKIEKLYEERKELTEDMAEAVARATKKYTREMERLNDKLIKLEERMERTEDEDKIKALDKDADKIKYELKEYGEIERAYEVFVDYAKGVSDGNPYGLMELALPKFSGKTFGEEARTITHETFTGKVQVIVFFSFQNRSGLAGFKDVESLGGSLDPEKAVAYAVCVDPPEVMAENLTGKKPGIPVIADPSHTVSNAFIVRLLPHAVVTNTAGTVVRVEIGRLKKSDLRSLVRDLVKDAEK